MNADPPHPLDPVDPFPDDPRDFIASWAASRGQLRRFIEGAVIPPLDEESQREAGRAAAEEAFHETFGLEFKDFSTGVDSVSGSIRAAGGWRLTEPDPDIPVDVGAAAFFDVDNTLIQGSSLVELALGMARKKFFSLREITPVAWKQLKFRITGRENAGDVDKGRSQALEFIQGRKVSDLVEIGEEIVENKMIDKVYSGTRELAQMHLDAGQQVWLVTATPVQLAQILAKRLGFTGALGTVAEAADGVFTGRLVGDILHGPGKAHAVAALAALEELDLAKCTAYSDSINDIPMLSMVGTAVAINPDAKLKAEAQRRGWAVRDYRNARRAVKTWGVPTLVTAGFSLWRLRLRARRKAARAAS
ncbi:MAG TPA: HAD-IB family hydrolase [Corynebacterium sp.]|nr:HAD-IB family hydrolase [Corynebacterium sp.]